LKSCYNKRKALSDCRKSPVQPTCADGRDTYRTAKLSRCQWQKQAKRSWGRRPNLRARCAVRRKFGQRQPLALLTVVAAVLICKAAPQLFAYQERKAA